VATHIWHINTDPVTKDSMFTEDDFVVLDEDGHAAVTLDFVCLQCHQSETVEWAAEYAEDIHDGIVGVGDGLVDLPQDVTLRQNYPNPFAHSTSIHFEITQSGYVELFVFNVAGQKVKTLVSSMLDAGIHHVTWDGLDEFGHPAATGVYFCQLNMNGMEGQQRMVLIE
jgi:hypothetical protein